MIHSSLPLLAVFVTVVSADISSVGKNFDVVFPVNNADYVMNSTISLEFIRYGGPKSSVDINIDYPLFTSKKGTVVRRVKRIYVHLVARGQSVNFDGSAIYRDINVGLQKYPDMRFLIRANSPISVIAHNYARDGSGDSFTVLSKEMAGTTYALSIPHISSIGYAAIYFFPIKKDTNIDITVVGENSTDSRKITAKDNATFVYRRSGAAFSLYARGNNPYHVVVGVRRYKSDEIAGLTTSMNYMPLPLPAPGCNIGGSQFDCISDMKLSNKFTVTPPAQGCPPFDVELQGKSVADRFSVDPKKPQPVRSWKSNLGDFGVIRPRSSYLQCVRLGGGKTSEGKTVGPFMDTMPSQLQFINGTIYFIARSTNEMMTIIAEENAKKNISMDNRKIEEKEWKTMKYGNKVVYYCTLKITGSEYHSVHSNGYYIAQITGITNSESSYGYLPALHAITVTPPEPTESTPVTTRTQPPSPSSSSTPPIKASTTKKASTTTKATVPATSTIMTSSIVSSTQGSKISTSTAPSQSTTSGTSSLIKRNAVVISAFAMALLTLRSPFNTLF